ncbi:site-specific DNA-methyltransferase [Jeotgalicoccus coquinae]|uniref:Adenine-specific DNA-methyltransferase n=1 Tax=Jeotgalicoccus coquinae TaxID=709509 RepID=A0A6V7RRN7_9STAP|nr:DNA methyltransferase [Jeotgalicoccus coquinae]MBB6423228.1 adenine-specific DNA-methyltransferase [Jeotgalicoccus coquinae]GGE09665.1 site-specific DNA-methyltransferase [Jeotgalicoccus coquinae]CAD2081922.1 putative methyltransferase [Jeotgalicoccus coquinae]
MEKIDGKSLDLREDSIDKLKQLFPDTVTEGEQINFEKLKAILTDDLDESNEKYTFTWNGKSKAMRIANTPTNGTLKPVLDKSKEWGTTENLYIEGDNLEVLKLLQKSYSNKIKVIYIDPPYNTGNDFVYNDKFSDILENYLNQTGQVNEDGYKLSTNQESSGRFHSDWLNMIYPRLKVARNLLKHNGVIFLSIDDNEYVNLKKVCDEIFGENNFVGTFLWNKSQNPPSLSHTIRRKFEYVLCYKKDTLSEKLFGGVMSGGDSPLYNGGNPVSILKFPPKSVSFNISDGVYKKSNDSMIDLVQPVEIKDSVNRNELILKGQFRWSQETLINELSNGTEIIVKSDKFSPRYARKGDRMMVPSDLLSMKENEVNTNEKGRKEIEVLFGENIFSFPKPTSLIEYLINTVTYNSKDDIILDFFSGSGTTAHATMNLNVEDNGQRKYIMVQLPEKLNEDSSAYKDGFNTIPDIAIERINRAGNKIIEENPDLENKLDIGYKYFKLDKSNIKKWNVDEDNIEDELTLFTDNFEEGSTHDDIVYELLLKQGIELTVPSEKVTFTDTSIFIIANGAMFVVIGNNIDETIAEYIRDYESIFNKDEDSEIVVAFQDIGFEDDSAKLNTFEILKAAGFKDENIFTI